jgi:hypothetical protein
MVGPCYGSVAPAGKSYTEREYEAAVKHERPCLVFRTADNFPLPANLIESDETRKRQLKFQQKVAKSRLITRFSSSGEVSLQIVQALRNWEATQVVRPVPNKLTKKELFEYSLKKVPRKKVGIITGDIRDVKGIDVWVSSENTNMEMARHFDASISGVIRYYGALKNEMGQVTVDVIANELAMAVGVNANVTPETIVVTGAGDLERTNAVKKIFHAAAIIGQPGGGYTPIPNISNCVRNALAMADDDELKGVELKSILIPLIGTSTPEGELEQKTKELIGAAIEWMEAYPEGQLDRVYFLVWEGRQLEACRKVLQESEGVESNRGLAARHTK